jgi:Ca-activated chloride channel family protein
LSRPDGARLTKADVPLDLPAGWEFDKLFGEKPPAPRPDRADAPGTDRAGLSRIQVASAADVTAGGPVMSKAGAPAQGVPLPATATDAELRVLLGLLLLASSVLMAAFGRRRHAYGA